MEHEDSSNSNIKVAIWVRPLIEKETSAGEFEISWVEDNLIVILDPIELEYDK